MKQKKSISKKYNYLFVYAICLIVSLVFFFFFSHNSPIFCFNDDIDYQWYMTLGNGLVHGKIPYRDIFEHKGPIVYFFTAFCCLFPNPGIIMLLLESIITSLFFLITYIICKKRLNNFYSLISIPILALTLFTSWIRFGHGSMTEEYCFPILACMLLYWLEFLQEKKPWKWPQLLIIGIFMSICFWIKLTIVSFFVIPMLTWLVLTLIKEKFKSTFKDLLIIFAGFLIITIPIIIFYALNHAIDDLWFAYFVFNMTIYPNSSFTSFFTYLTSFISIGPLLVFFIIYGVIKFTVHNWKNFDGQILLLSFLTVLITLAWTCKGNIYYYNVLTPYAILGIAESLYFLKSHIKLPSINNYILLSYFTTFCLALSILFSKFPTECSYTNEDHTPVVIANIITNYKEKNNPNTTLLYYMMGDNGIHNLTGILPNNFYFALNYVNKEQFPEIFNASRDYITNQTSDFIITHFEIWDFDKDFLSQYYQPYTGDIETSTFDYKCNQEFGGKFVLLFKKI